MKNALISIGAVVVGTMSGIAAAEPQPVSNKATIVIDTDAPTKKYDRMMFGGFIEHLGKQIYGGFFEPGSPLADKKGFRLDVIKAIKESINEFN